MSENLFQLFTTQFSTNLKLKLQQKGSKLRGRVMEGFHVGKQASPVNQIGAVQVQAPSGRFAPLQHVDASFTRRWVFPQPGDLPQLIDSFDELETIVDPKSMYVENAANAFGRAWDDTLIAAAFGTSQTGTDGAAFSSETWSSFSGSYTVANTFGSGATSSGLTVAKLIEAKRIFRHYHVDIENDPLTVVIGSTQESDLLKQAQVVSSDFNKNGGVLENGHVTRLLGFDIVVSERLTVASNVRKCIAFPKSGLYLGLWRDLENRVSIRDDLSSNPYQLYTKSMYGATRLEPGRMVEVDCADTVGADITP